MEFRKHQLPNGLEIVAECNPLAHTMALGFFVSTGARDETDEVAGVSHFLEHMMFKGTPTRTADDVNREFDEMGAHYNAYTSEENTVYYAAILPEHQQRTAGLLADMLRPSLRAEDFDTEKNVILEEIKMYLDQPPYGADDRVRALHFAKHPLGRSVLGTEVTVGGLPLAAMQDYFQRRYSPRNIVVAGAGRVDFDALIQDIERLCGGWQPADGPRNVLPAVPQAGFECLQRPQSAQEYCLQLASGPSATDEDRYAAKVLATVLGDDEGSRLYWALVDPGLAENASLSHYDYQGAGLMMTYVSGDPDNAASNLQVVLDLYREAEAEGITQAELDQARAKITSRIVLGSERPSGRLFNVGGNWTQRRCYRSVGEDLRTIDALTLADVARVLRKYPLSTCATVCVGPLADVPPPR